MFAYNFTEGSSRQILELRGGSLLTCATFSSVVYVLLIVTVRVWIHGTELNKLICILLVKTFSFFAE